MFQFLQNSYSTEHVELNMDIIALYYNHACEATSILLSTVEFTLCSKINNTCSTLQPGRPGCKIGWLSGFAWTASSYRLDIHGYRKWIYPNRHYNCWGVTPKVVVTGGGFAVTLKQYSFI